VRLLPKAADFKTLLQGSSPFIGLICIGCLSVQIRYSAISANITILLQKLGFNEYRLKDDF